MTDDALIANADLAEIARLRAALDYANGLVRLERAWRKEAQAELERLRASIELLYQWHAVSAMTDYGLHGPGCRVCDVVRMARAKEGKE